METRKPPMPPLYEQFEQVLIAPVLEGTKEGWRTDRPFFISGLNPSFPLRAYQEEAIARFEFVLKNRLFPDKKRHFLFNLATGSGKTLLMASQILRLYEDGYRLFLFFVNSDAVVRKTRDNFLAATSSKRQFAQSLSYQGRPVDIREIASPDDINPDAINILFTTIQGLHVRLKTPRENGVTFETLAERKLVLLADEAHHLNAAKGEKAKQEATTWQETVETLLNGNPENVLLEYTATVDWNKPAIRDKYAPRCLIRYDLKAFREDRYSKDVYLHLSQGDRDERLLRACLASYYRGEAAEAHGVTLKPLVLVKSRTVQKSADDEAEFRRLLAGLDAGHIAALRQSAGKDADQDRSIVARAFRFFDRQGMDDGWIASALFTLYAKDGCVLLVNSRNRAALESGELARLEDRNNPVRVVFVVDMLNEGWDVLNLFDIVRLDESDRADASIKTKDVQLIGRGARYFPFAHGEESRFQRKFDGVLTHDLRALEEMHYHSRNDSKFIASLTAALVDAGLQDGKSKPFTYQVKDKLKNTDFWQSRLFKNDRAPSPRRVARNEWPWKITLSWTAPGATDINAFTGQNPRPGMEFQTYDICLSQLGPAVLLRALSLPEAAFFRFDSIGQSLSGVDGPLRLSQDFLMETEAAVHAQVGFDVAALTPREKLALARQALEVIQKYLRPKFTKYQGDKRFTPVLVSELLGRQDKILRQISLANDRNGQGHSIIHEADTGLHVDVGAADWYALDDNHGTSEEKRLIRHIHDKRDDLSARYAQFVLLRNEKFITLHAFDDGEPFEPDFLFWAKRKDGTEIVLAYAEAKGPQLVDMDRWKEEALLRVKADAQLDAMFRQAGYRLLGLPFLTTDDNGQFPVFAKSFAENLLPAA